MRNMALAVQLAWLGSIGNSAISLQHERTCAAMNCLLILVVCDYFFGNGSIQVFYIVSQGPRGMGCHQNSGNVTKPMSSNSGDVEDTISGAFVLVDNKVFRRQTRLAWQTLGHFRATNQSHSKIVDPVRMRCDMCFSKTRHFDPFCPYTFSLLCCCLFSPRKRIIRSHPTFFPAICLKEDGGCSTGLL